ncbi:hypothetical protein C8F04DRAFT_1186621 [Mycena alexandri]|uniref:Uncharacterized protein n=1 Tax=Mycena alexandri TaxID=1745969 RepID=A0AAD6SN15_9AGAR|nr:hypothetical protein C8F04DRAFT_1186621 [Mycena alexandri]
MASTWASSRTQSRRVKFALIMRMDVDSAFELPNPLHSTRIEVGGPPQSTITTKARRPSFLSQAGCDYEHPLGDQHYWAQLHPGLLCAKYPEALSLWGKWRVLDAHGIVIRDWRAGEPSLVNHNVVRTNGRVSIGAQSGEGILAAQSSLGLQELEAAQSGPNMARTKHSKYDFRSQQPPRNVSPGQSWYHVIDHLHIEPQSYYATMYDINTLPGCLSVQTAIPVLLLPTYLDGIAYLLVQLWSTGNTEKDNVSFTDSLLSSVPSSPHFNMSNVPTITTDLESDSEQLVDVVQYPPSSAATFVLPPSTVDLGHTSQFSSDIAAPSPVADSVLDSPRMGGSVDVIADGQLYSALMGGAVDMIAAGPISYPPQVTGSPSSALISRSSAVSAPEPSMIHTTQESDIGNMTNQPIHFKDQTSISFVPMALGALQDLLVQEENVLPSIALLFQCIRYQLFGVISHLSIGLNASVEYPRCNILYCSGSKRKLGGTQMTREFVHECQARAKQYHPSSSGRHLVDNLINTLSIVKTLRETRGASWRPDLGRGPSWGVNDRINRHNLLTTFARINHGRIFLVCSPQTSRSHQLEIYSNPAAYSMDPLDPQFLASRVKGALDKKAAIQAWYLALPIYSSDFARLLRSATVTTLLDVRSARLESSIARLETSIYHINNVIWVQAPPPSHQMDFQSHDMQIPHYSPPPPSTITEYGVINTKRTPDMHDIGSSISPGAVSSSDWSVPQDHPLLAMLQLQRDEIARLRARLSKRNANNHKSESGAVVDAAHKAQHFAIEHLYVFKAKLLNQPRPLSVESQGFLDLSDWLEEVFSQLYFEIDSAVAPVY